MRFFQRGLFWLVGLSFKFPRRVLAVWLIALVLGLVSLLNLKFLVLLEDLIDPDFQTYNQLQEVNDSFKDQHQVFVILSNKNEQSLSKSQICQIRTWIQKVVDQPLGVSRVLSSFGVREFYQDGQKMDWLKFLDVDCARPWLEEQENVKRGFEGLTQTPWKTLFGNKSDIIVLFDLYPLPEETRFGVFNSKAIDDLKLSFQSELESQDNSLVAHWGGLGLYLYYLKIGYFWGIAINQLAISLVVLLFWFLFRSGKAAFLYWLAFQASIIPTLGLMSYFGKPIDSLNNALPIMVLMACAEDFVFLFYWLHQKAGSLKKTFARLILPSFLTSVTTVVGFGSLMLSDFGLARDFGLWAAVAALLEWVVLVSFIPCLLILFPKLKPQNLSTPRGLGFYKKIQQLEISKKWATVLAGLALLPLFFLNHLNYTDAPERIFPESHQLRESSRWILNNRGWLTDVSLIFDSAVDEELQSHLVEHIAQLPFVVGSESIFEINRFFKRNMPDSWGNVVFDGWKQSLSGSRLINDHMGVERTLLFLETSDIVKVSQLQNQVSDICKGSCYLAGTLVSYTELGQKVMSSFFKSMAGSAGLIVLFVAILFFIYGQAKNLSVMLTVFWGPMIVLGFFEAFQWPVFFVTSISMAILIGVTGDTAIHFVTHRKSQSVSSAADQLGFPSFQALIVMVVAVAPLLVSYYGAMRLLGAVMVLGLLLSFFGDYLLFRALYKKSGD